MKWDSIGHHKNSQIIMAAGLIIALSLTGCTTKLSSESIDGGKVKEQTVEASKNTPKLEISEEKKEEKNKYTLEFKMPKLINSGNVKTEEVINSLLKKDADDLKNDVVGSRTDLEKDSEMRDKLDSPIFQYFASSEVVSQKLTNEYLSLAMGYTSFTGGAHGMYNVVPYNYKLADGKVFGLKDILMDSEGDIKTINAEIIKQIQDKHIELYDEAKPQIDIHYDLFYIKDKSLVIYYNSYAIAPYAAGTLYFEVPFEKLHLADWVK